MVKFTHLHVHSHYSLLDGLPKIDELLNYAKESGMNSLALTDHGALYGAVEFYKKAKEKGIKPIIGAEVYMALEKMSDKRPNIDDKRYHLVLLVKNEEGYKNLVKLITKAHLEGFYYKPRIDDELLAKHSAGLIGLSACLQGKIPRLILANRQDDAKKQALKYQEIFGKGNFYLEIQHHPNNSDQIKANKAIINISRELNIPLVATNDSHYLKPEDSQTQDILMLINTGADPNDPERLTMRTDDFSLKKPEEMEKIFSETPEAIENTQKIVAECDFQFELGKIKLPHFEVPNGKKPDEYLEELCEKGLETRFGKNPEPETIKRMDYELSVIKKTGFASYFLIVQDFVNWAKSNHIVVGPGRGCLLPSTTILMADGTQKPIQEIKINDLVISGNGKSQKVTNLFSYDIDEKVAIIEAKMPTKNLSLTNDHKVLAVRHKMCPVMKGGKKTICKPTCRRSCKNKLWEGCKLEWIESKNLKRNDFLVYPITPVYHCREINFDLLKFDKRLKSDNKYVWYEIGTNKLILKKIKRYIELDNKLARLLGFYISEGWVRLEKKFKGRDISHGIIGFGFHQKEKKYIKEVRNLLKEVFGLDSHLKLHNYKKSYQITAHSRVVAKFLKKLCGKGAPNKRIPSQIIKSPNEIIISLLSTLFKGDGSNRTIMRINFDSTSYNLISQVKLLLAKLGIMSSIKYRQYKGKSWNLSYKLRFSGEQLFKYNQIFKDFKARIIKQKFYRNDTFIQENYIFFPVKNIKFKNYKGKVYDFTVKNDVSYVGNEITVHNSVGGSLVAYLTNITNIDPLKNNLLFERFLTGERVSPPDIDLDFTDRRRNEVINYIAEKYGKDHVAQIITFGTMAARAVIRDVGRALGYPYGYCDRMAKMIPFGITLEETLQNIKEFRELYESDVQAKKMIDLAKNLEGVARHASTHACGVVISKEPLTDYVPLQHPTQDDQTIVTQYEMHAIEDLGLLKMDLLGLKNLTIIEDCLARIYQIYNKSIKIDDTPLDDEKTYKLFQEANTVGVFQLECLSGKTIISNTTIKKLYEKKNKRALASVYLDEGKVHKNKIIDVKESGEKELYTLITDNGWFIKASKDHNFLTENGWKKLEEIKIDEDKVLMKMRAKHLVYNTCQTCGEEIDGQKDGKSKFCYRCSASFYRNPSKEISRKKISEGKIKFYKNGGRPWNYGVNTKNNEIWKKTAEKISKALTGIKLEERWGKERAENFKKAQSERSRGMKNPMFGKPSPHSKRGFRADLNHYVRSSWEADFARILNLHNIKYLYEPKTFKLIRSNDEVLTYTPDFYTPSNNTFYEIKGWFHDLDKEKVDLFQKQYPQYKFILISATKFAEFSLKYKTLVEWECPRIPIKQSFQFIRIKEVKYSGREKTYDIIMQSPGNNFVANGFVVHNSDGMQRYLKELKPTTFEDIVAMCALYRPGPMQFIPDFIKGKHKKKKIEYLHPKLKPILESTYNVCIYQEQLMQIVQQLAGFSLSEADVLRKAIGKKIKNLLQSQEEKFISGCLKNGLKKTDAEKIWRWILPFAEYGFNKSHSAAYATIAYQTAYLKAHYPVEFMAALLTSEKSDIERIAILIKECKKMGIQVLAPDINESFRNFSVVPEENKIRFGLLAIKNVGENIVEAVIAERKTGGPFKSIYDFISRIQSKNLNKKSMESLIKAGVFDRLEERSKLLYNLEDILEANREIKQNLNNGQKSLFHNCASFNNNSFLKLKDGQNISLTEKLNWEKELLGLYISAHPLDGFQNLLAKKTYPLDGLKEDIVGKLVKIGGIISTVKRVITRTGKPMLFLTLEDISNKIEVVAFPGVIEKNPAVFQENKIVFVKGRVDNRNGEIKVIADEVEEIINHET